MYNASAMIADCRPVLRLTVLRLPQRGEGLTRKKAPFGFARGFDLILPIVAR